MISVIFILEIGLEHLYLIFAFLLLGCSASETKGDSAESIPVSEPEISEPSTEDPEWITAVGTLELEKELLAEQVDLAVISNFRVFFRKADGSWFYDPASMELLHFADHQLLDAIVGPTGTPILFMQDGVFVWDGELLLSPLNAHWEDEIIDIQSDESGFWINGASGLYRWKGDSFSLTQVGADLVSIAAGGYWREYPALWFSSEGIHAMVDTPSGLSIAASVPIQGRTLSIDRRDQVWVLDEDGFVFLRRDGWNKLLIPGSVMELAGNSKSDRVWIRLEDTCWVHEDGEFHAVPIPDGEWIDVDAAGRLVTLDSSNLYRYTVDREAGFVGLPRNRIDRSQSIAIDPPFADQIQHITVHLGDVSLTLEELPWTFWIDPVEIGDGDLSITAELVYQDGTTFETNLIRSIVLGNVSWENDISPLNSSKCLYCHEGSTFTLLNSKELWIEKIDKIIENVENGQMPQGQNPLSVDEIGKIKLWRDGGFQ